MDGQNWDAKNQGGPSSVSPHHTVTVVVTGSNEQPAGLLCPWSLGSVLHHRSRSPRSDAACPRIEMQLREVGKLDVYLWKIHWLQRPSPGVLLWALWFVEATHPGWCLRALAGDQSVSCPHPLCLFRGRGLCQRGPVPQAQPIPGTTWWLTWNCCCAGESDCLIETQLCEGTGGLMPRGDFCPVL